MTNKNHKLSDLNSDFQRFVTDLLLRKNASHLCTEISTEDEMFVKAIMPSYENELNISYFKYIESVFRMFDVYHQLVEAHFENFSKVVNVLDFGSGYGRLTRSLINHLLAKNIWVSDIYSEAMAWQEQMFGVKTIVSVKDPDQFTLDQSFSVVFAGSVFSHLPDALFQRWLKRLYHLTSPDGILVFSVHDEKSLPAGERMGKDGIHYLTFSESDSLSTDVYGMTYVTDAYIKRSVEQLDPFQHLQFHRFPKALYENQDLYVIVKNKIRHPGFTIKISPMGGFITMYPGPEKSITFSGWAIDLNQGHHVISFVVFCDARQIHDSTTLKDYEEVSRFFPGAPNMPVLWSFTLPASMFQAHCLIRIELHSSSGSVGYAYATVPEGDMVPGFLRGLAT